MSGLHDRLRDVYEDEDQSMVILTGAGVTFRASKDQRALWPGLLRDGLKACVDFGKGTVDEAWRDRWIAVLDGAITAFDVEELAIVGEVVQARLNKVGEMQQWIDRSIGAFQIEQPDILDILGRTNLPLATVNYDSLLEKRISDTIRACGTLDWKHPAAFMWPRGPRGSEVLHIHGEASNAANIVLGTRSYDRSLLHEPIQLVLKNLTTNHSLLFVGWGSGLEDPNFGALFSWLGKFLPERPGPPHFALVPDSEVAPLQARLGNAHPVQVLSYGHDYDSLVPYLQRLTGDLPLPPDVFLARPHVRIQDAIRQYNRGAGSGGGDDFFSSASFGSLASEAKEWLDMLTDEERAFLLKGALYVGLGKGFGLIEYLPPKDAAWAIEPIAYFLERTYRRAAYRSALVGQNMAVAGCDSAFEEALKKSTIRARDDLFRAIRNKDVVDFLGSDQCCDLDSDERRKLVSVGATIEAEMNAS